MYVRLIRSKVLQPLQMRAASSSLERVLSRSMPSDRNIYYYHTKHVCVYESIYRFPFKRFVLLKRSKAKPFHVLRMESNYFFVRTRYRDIKESRKFPKQQGNVMWQRGILSCNSVDRVIS